MLQGLLKSVEVGKEWVSQNGKGNLKAPRKEKLPFHPPSKHPFPGIYFPYHPPTYLIRMMIS